jgi:hypothetical protein
MHGMGIDEAGNIYAGVTRLGCVGEYVRMQ